MEAGFGNVPPFIALLSGGAQAGAWTFMKGSLGSPNGEMTRPVAEHRDGSGRQAWHFFQG